MSLFEATAQRHRHATSDRALQAGNLFSPYQLGRLALANRMVLSPMTRSRALDGNVPNPLAATYYAQRASAGLLITEASQVSPQGVGYIRTPGMHSQAQVAGWKPAARFSRSSGTLGAFRIRTFTTVRCRLLHRRCRSRARRSPLTVRSGS